MPFYAYVVARVSEELKYSEEIKYSEELKYSEEINKPEDDLLSHLRRNISTAAIFKADNSLKVYTDSKDVWIVCYYASKPGAISLELELRGSGYAIEMSLDEIGGIPYSYKDGFDIPKLVGFVAFQSVTLDANIVEEFRTEFNPKIYNALINQNNDIDKALFKLETNIEYLAQYIVMYVNRFQYIPENIRSIIQHRISDDGDIDLVEFAGLLTAFSPDIYYPGYVLDLIC